MPAAAIAGVAMLLPVQLKVVHVVPACDDTVPEPGAYISGFRRLSNVGPNPPVDTLFVLAALEAATQRPLLEVNGGLIGLGAPLTLFPEETTTSWSSLFQVKLSRSWLNNV